MSLFNIAPGRRKPEQLSAYNYDLTFRRLAQIAIDNIEWEGAPDETESKHFEIPLFNTGAAVFFYDPSIGYCVLPAAMEGDLDVYWEPTRWSVIGGAGLTKQLDATNSVLIRNNLFGAPTITDVEFFARKITNIERTISTQLELMKMPFLVKTTDKTLLSYKNILERKREGDLAIFVSPKVSGDDFQVFGTPTPFVLDRLYDYRNEIEAEFMGMLGYNNNPAEKKERLLVDEVTANDEFTEQGYAGMMLQCRRDACKKINKLFGLNMDCVLKRTKNKSDWYYRGLESGNMGENSDGASGKMWENSDEASENISDKADESAKGGK